MVLPVGDQDQGPGCPSVGRKGADRCLNRLPDRCPRYRDEIRVEIIEEDLESAVVERQRALHEGGPCEGDQPHPVSLEHIDEIRDLPFRTLQAVGLDVLGEHTLRDVDGNDEIDPFPLDLFPVESPPGSEKGGEQEGDTCQHHEEPGHLPLAAYIGHEPVPEPGVGEEAEKLVLLPEGIDGQQDHGRKNP